MPTMPMSETTIPSPAGAAWSGQHAVRSESQAPRDALCSFFQSGE